HLLGTVNRILALIGAVTGAAVVTWLVLHGRARRQRNAQPVTAAVVDAVLERVGPGSGAS
ncbi:MAG: hypothetical protein ACREL2_00070, partial [Gemmatimonadales bacterium]